MKKTNPNKPKVKIGKMTVTSLRTMNYELRTMNYFMQNKPNFIRLRRIQTEPAPHLPYSFAFWPPKIPLDKTSSTLIIPQNLRRLVSAFRSIFRAKYPRIVALLRNGLCKERSFGSALSLSQ